MTRKIAMTTIRTVLTMLNSGFSYSKIRHHKGASNGFINKLASAARSDLEAFVKLSDEEIYERVYPKTPNSHCEPNWEPSLSKYFLIANQEGTEKINGHPISARKEKSNPRENPFQGDYG